ncbi:hypothetical protein COY07_01385 [Candidatus Peregrinibacteria bacterium CG_4_10_14_0_2_um_filter_43_11]|nr:MAG: hypothetical protein COY07_01385 [Candidatus Peregrinibacteria bacterium CG_4_10_14_0_2_um_filter_43_11]
MNKKVLTILILILTISGLLINNKIEFIPSWLLADESINYISLILLVISTLLAILLIYSLIRNRTKISTKLLFQWTKIIVFSLGIVGYLYFFISFTILYSKHSIFERMFSGREFIMELNYPEFGKTYYIYEHPCFLGATIKDPCSDFGSILYIKQGWFPAMYEVAKFPFPAGEIKKRNNFVEIHPDGKGWNFNQDYLILDLETNKSQIIQKQSKGTSYN